jgi:hypothetical protein
MTEKASGTITRRMMSSTQHEAYIESFQYACTKAASTETRKAFENQLHTQPNYKQQAT